MLKVSPKVVDFFPNRGVGKRHMVTHTYFTPVPTDHKSVSALGQNSKIFDFFREIISPLIDSMVKRISLTRRCDLKAKEVL